MQELERLLLKTSPTRRRNVVVVYGLGGIGKTQLAVEFAREYKRKFSAIFWLDGSSEASLKQSFIDALQRLPRDELTAAGVELVKQATPDANMAIRECSQWLSLSSNYAWLLIFDNVDRDKDDKDDPQAYNVKDYFPHADHGSILITSRLTSLQNCGEGVKIETVGAEQARAILESNAKRVVEGESTSTLMLAITSCLLIGVI